MSSLPEVETTDGFSSDASEAANPPAGDPSAGKSHPADAQLVGSTLEGNVRWYSLAKGYGFMAAAELSQEVFVHHTALAKGVQLWEDDPVRFELGEGPKGLLAKNVERL